jgi:hypothetical protein
MRSRKPAPPPPSRWKLPALLAASLLLVAVTGTFTYARFRNDAARRRVDAACTTLRSAEDERAAAVKSAAKLAQKGDVEKVAAIENASRESRVCEPLREQLSGYHWNFGRHWSAPPVDPASLPSREEIAAIGARARPRCVAQVGMFLALITDAGTGPSAEKRQELLDLCDLEKQSDKALAPSTARPLRLLDEWPAELERRAAGVAPTPQPDSSSIE